MRKPSRSASVITKMTPVRGTGLNAPGVVCAISVMAGRTVAKPARFARLLHWAGMDRIDLNGFTVDCVIGTYPSERHTPQPLRLDLSLGLSTEPAARKESLSASVDYAVLAGQLGFLLR